jgi:hypothetical protein
VQSFLGFANFYWRFIKGFSVIAQPLISLSSKEAPFEWTTVAQTTFDLLKESFTIVPVLLHPDPTNPFHVETDASISPAGQSSLNEMRLVCFTWWLITHPNSLLRK